MRLIIIVVAIFAGVVIGWASHASQQERWEATVYPVEGSLATYQRLGDFASIEQCRTAARTLLEALDAPAGDFECGLDCRPQMEQGRSAVESMHICEESRR